jgi:phage gp36-like protein
VHSLDRVVYERERREKEMAKAQQALRDIEAEIRSDRGLANREELEKVSALLSPSRSLCSPAWSVLASTREPP